MGVDRNGTGILTGWARALGAWRRGWAWVFDLGALLLCLPDLFSNPYVALKPRADAAAKMYADLASDDGESFCALAREHRVHYVVLAASKRITRKQRRFLSRVFSSDDREKGWDIYEIADENRAGG